MGRFGTGYEFKTEEEYNGTPRAQVPYMGLSNGLMANTTAHGLPHIYYARGCFKSLMWIFFTLLAVGWWLYNTYVIVNDYIKFGTNVDIEITNLRSLVFPAVTICNLNPLRISEVYKNDALYQRINGSALDGVSVPDYYDDYYDGDDQDYDNVDTGARQEGMTRVEYLAEYLADNGEAFMQPLGHQKQNLIQKCVFNGYSCKMNRITTIYNWYYGNCYTFNSGINITTMAGGGSTTNSSNTGPLYGLRLILNIEQDEYLGDLSDQAGARVLIHDQNTMPFPEDEGISVPAGVATSIGIKQNNVNRKGGRYGSCVQTEGDHTDINMYEEKYPWSNYTQQACMRTCFQRNLVKNCSCADSRYPLEGAALEYADLENLQACSSVDNAQEKCKTQVALEYSNGTLSCSNCTRPCSETYYSYSVSSAAWPATNYMKTTTYLLAANYVHRLCRDQADGQCWHVGGCENTLQAALPAIPAITSDPALVAQNLLQIDVYYQELNVQTLKETPAYDDGQFLSDLGGAVGLWVGASLITVLEYFEYGLDLLVLACLKCGKKNNISSREARNQPRNQPRTTPVKRFNGQMDYGQYSSKGNAPRPSLAD